MNTKAICQVSIAPVRKDSSDSSEMVTQLLFGELCHILEVRNQWMRIKILFDSYEGWVDYKQLLPLTDNEFETLSEKCSYIADPFSLLILNSQPFPLPIGSEIHNLDEQGNCSLTKNHNFLVEEKLTEGQLSKSQLLDIAFKYINTPYLWGGKSTYGIDCSGLAQMVYKIAGYKLPRDAYQQAEIGEVLSFIEEAEPGDLAFFENNEGEIIHVGFILENQKILHAHGKVRIDNLDYTGIFNLELNKYTHHLRLIRRIF